MIVVRWVGRQTDKQTTLLIYFAALSLLFVILMSLYDALVLYSLSPFRCFFSLSLHMNSLSNWPVNRDQHRRIGHPAFKQNAWLSEHFVYARYLTMRGLLLLFPVHVLKVQFKHFLGMTPWQHFLYLGQSQVGFFKNRSISWQQTPDARETGLEGLG